MIPDSSYAVSEPSRAGLLRRGLNLEYATLGWNVVGTIVIGNATGDNRKHQADHALACRNILTTVSDGYVNFSASGQKPHTGQMRVRSGDFDSELRPSPVLSSDRRAHFICQNQLSLGPMKKGCFADDAYLS
ncbi:hypothetical protein [Caballeronia sp. M23-90]